MSTELLSPELDADLQKEEYESDEITMKNMELEIECPRCSDTMSLSSDFDKLL
jgi:hypothetical protein